MQRFVSKSSFKAKALEYLREVELTGKELVITAHGKPVLKIVPYRHDPMEALRSLRGSVIRYENPLEPVGIKDLPPVDEAELVLAADQIFLDLDRREEQD